MTICKHGILGSLCIPCGKSAICEHGRSRQYCVPCRGVSICEHKRQRKACKVCSPVQCECGAVLSRATIARHRRSPKHIAWQSAKGNAKREFHQLIKLWTVTDSNSPNMKLHHITLIFYIRGQGGVLPKLSDHVTRRVMDSSGGIWI